MWLAHCKVSLLVFLLRTSKKYPCVKNGKGVHDAHEPHPLQQLYLSTYLSIYPSFYGKHAHHKLCPLLEYYALQCTACCHGEHEHRSMWCGFVIPPPACHYSSNTKLMISISSSAQTHVGAHSFSSNIDTQLTTRFALIAMLTSSWLCSKLNVSICHINTYQIKHKTSNHK